MARFGRGFSPRVRRNIVRVVRSTRTIQQTSVAYIGKGVSTQVQGGEVTSSTFTITPVAIGDLIVLGTGTLASTSPSDITVSSTGGISGAWKEASYVIYNGAQTAIFWGQVTSLSTINVTITNGGSSTFHDGQFEEFSPPAGVSNGQWILSNSGTTSGDNGALDYPSLTTAASETYFGFLFVDASVAGTGTPSGVTFGITPTHDNGFAYEASTSAGTLSPIDSASNEGYWRAAAGLWSFQPTKTQVATSRISASPSVSTSSISRTSQQRTKTTLSQARSSVVETKTTSATARSSSSKTATVPSSARTSSSQTKTVESSADLSKAFTRTTTSTAWAANFTVRTKTQSQTSRLSYTAVKSTTSTSRASVTRTFTQPSSARTSTYRVVTQPSAVRVATVRNGTTVSRSSLVASKTFTVTQTADVSARVQATQRSDASISVLSKATQTSTASLRVTKTFHIIEVSSKEEEATVAEVVNTAMYEATVSVYESIDGQAVLNPPTFYRSN